MTSISRISVRRQDTRFRRGGATRSPKSPSRFGAAKQIPETARGDDWQRRTLAEPDDCRITGDEHIGAASDRGCHDPLVLRVADLETQVPWNALRLASSET